MRDMEVSHLRGAYNRTVKLSKMIWEHRYLIQEIKDLIEYETLQKASELWNDLDYPIQELLIIAPRFGGPFTTQERKIVKDFWVVTVEDIEK
jgi:hypothetical protein